MAGEHTLNRVLVAMGRALLCGCTWCGISPDANNYILTSAAISDVSFLQLEIGQLLVMGCEVHLRIDLSCLVCASPDPALKL